MSILVPFLLLSFIARGTPRLVFIKSLIIIFDEHPRYFHIRVPALDGPEESRIPDVVVLPCLTS